jgi:hypothetical protein
MSTGSFICAINFIFAHNEERKMRPSLREALKYKYAFGVIVAGMTAAWVATHKAEPVKVGMSFDGKFTGEGTDNCPAIDGVVTVTNNSGDPHIQRAILRTMARDEVTVASDLNGSRPLVQAVQQFLSTQRKGCATDDAVPTKILPVHFSLNIEVDPILATACPANAEGNFGISINTNIAGKHAQEEGKIHLVYRGGKLVSAKAADASPVSTELGAIAESVIGKSGGLRRCEPPAQGYRQGQGAQLFAPRQ